MQALEKGAFDFITKPQGRSAAESKAMIVGELALGCARWPHRRHIRSILRPGSSGSSSPAPPDPSPYPIPRVQSGKIRLVCSESSRVGPDRRVDRRSGSAGTPAANIPRTSACPSSWFKHMPPIFTQSLAESLAASVPCVCAKPPTATGESRDWCLSPRGATASPVAAATDRRAPKLPTIPPENNCRPAVDYLFRSVANIFPAAMAVILTVWQRRYLGLRLLAPARLFHHRPGRSDIHRVGMPKAAVEAGVVDVVFAPRRDCGAHSRHRQGAGS